MIAVAKGGKRMLSFRLDGFGFNKGVKQRKERMLYSRLGKVTVVDQGMHAPSCPIIRLLLVNKNTPVDKSQNWISSSHLVLRRRSVFPQSLHSTRSQMERRAWLFDPFHVMHPRFPYKTPMVSSAASNASAVFMHHLPDIACPVHAIDPILITSIIITTLDDVHIPQAVIFKAASCISEDDVLAGGLSFKNIPYTLFCPFAASVMFENWASGNLFPALRLSRTLL